MNLTSPPLMKGTTLMSRKTSLIIKTFPARVKTPLLQIASGLSAEYGRHVSLSEVVVNACNAYVERIKVERSELLRAAVFTRTRDHALIVEAVEQGCANVEQVTIYINRARHEHLATDAIQFLVEDLLAARVLKEVAQGKAGGSAHGNCPQTILVKVKS